MDLEIGCSFVFGVPVAIHAVMLFEPHSTDLEQVVDSTLEIVEQAALPPSSTYVDSYGNRCRRITWSICTLVIGRCSSPMARADVNV